MMRTSEGRSIPNVTKQEPGSCNQSYNVTQSHVLLVELERGQSDQHVSATSSRF